MSEAWPASAIATHSNVDRCLLPTAAQNRPPNDVTLLPRVQKLVEDIRSTVESYVDYGWVKKFFSSGKFVEKFEEFDSQLDMFVRMLHFEVSVAIAGDVHHIRRNSQLNSAPTAPTAPVPETPEERKAREQKYAEDAGTRLLVPAPWLLTACG